MKRTTVRIGWPAGLHLRPAAQLVRLSQRFRATIWLRCGQRCADLRSILSIISLCAVMGATIDIEAAGEDEETAVQAVERFFESADDQDRSGGDVPESERSD